MEAHLWGTSSVATYFSISKRSAQAYLRRWKERPGEGPYVERVDGKYVVNRVELQAWCLDPNRQGRLPHSRPGRPRKTVRP